MSQQSFNYGITFSKKHAGGLVINDVKGLFDRTIHTVTILVLMSSILCPSHSILAFEILQVSEHHIKTVFGVSEHFYGIEYDG